MSDSKGGQASSGQIDTVIQTNNEELRVEKTFTITVKLPNEAPMLTLPEEAVVILGREFSLEATADDDGDELKFSFENEVPEGLAIDQASGEITWTPANTLKPGEYEVTVKVTDPGELSATDSLSLKVEDDHASLTKFTGSVALNAVSIEDPSDLVAIGYFAVSGRTFHATDEATHCCCRRNRSMRWY